MGSLRGSWNRIRSVDGANAVRRRTTMRIDRTWSAWSHRRRQPRSVPLDGDPVIALITVNFSTTRLLKLMLSTLSEQHDLDLVSRIVVVDNGTRDGGREFLRELDRRASNVHLVERDRWLYHAPAMRAGIAALDRIEGGHERPSNILLFCDPDVIFRDPDAIRTVAGSFLLGDVGVVGETRPGTPDPNIQASFLALRRDVYARSVVAPLRHDGSPARSTQKSIVAAGLGVIHVPSNHGGLILHRGRSGVAAAAGLHRGHQYATATNRAPHYMGVANGAAIWSEVEGQHARLLAPENEDDLLARLSGRLERRT